MERILSKHYSEYFLMKPEIDYFHDFFTFPKAEMNLIAMAHIYSINSLTHFGRGDLFTFIDKLYLGKYKIYKCNNLPI